MPFNPGIAKTTGCQQGSEKDSAFNFGCEKTATFDFEPEVVTCPTLAEYTTVYNAFTNKPSEADCAIQEQLVTDLVTASLWDSKLDRRFIMAIHTNAGGEAQLEWIDPVNNLPLLNVNGCTFTAYEGFTGGTGYKYMDTQFTPDIDGVNYIEGNASINWYNRWAPGKQNGYAYGAARSVPSAYTYCRPSTTTNFYEGDIQYHFVNFANTDLRLGLNTNSNDNNEILHRVNKSTLYNNTFGTSRIDVYSFFIFCRNFNGAPNSYSTHQISEFVLGSSYSTADHDNEFTAFNDVYLTAYGKQVA